MKTMDNNILPEFDLDKAANTLGDEIAKMVIEKLVKQGDLVPVGHAQWTIAHWIMPRNDDGMSDPIYYQVRCSKCGFGLDAQTWVQELQQYGADKYCPKCGAKMDEDPDKITILPFTQSDRKWTPCSNPPKHHRDVIVRGIEAIGNVTVHKVMQWDVDRWRPMDYAPSIIWKEWSEI